MQKARRAHYIIFSRIATVDMYTDQAMAPTLLFQHISHKLGYFLVWSGWKKNIPEWTNKRVEEIFHVARDKAAFKEVVANLC